MVKNTRAKGRNAELELKKKLEVAGWTVLLTPPPKKYNKENDFFNLFDIIAFKGQYRKYIQVRCNQKRSTKPHKLWGERFCNEYESVETWVRKDRKGWYAHTIFNVVEGDACVSH